MKSTLILLLCLGLAGCSGAASSPQPRPEVASNQAGEVNRLADEYVAAFFEVSC